MLANQPFGTAHILTSAPGTYRNLQHMRREVLPDVLEALRQQPCAVLQAPPGAGKTTTVPLAMLLQEPHYLQPQQRILVGWSHIVSVMPGLDDD